ncbi:threonine ammonia-lyase [Endozoicomonas atrinae]|uniref:threonine ammonia-lyase n=1 Tax=Endozoicomonas atrinae TaxID=1333660 RepID=UPI000825C1C3|nr:threonine/serine dehydratase [Endozoicomonas atrinae]
MKAEPKITLFPSFKTLSCAFQQIRGHIRNTPLIKSDYLSNLINGDVLIKAESLQVTGAFKFRGALYRLLNLTEKQQKQGVTAYSSGNFAAGLAAAGQILNIPVHLVMPHDAPGSKIQNAKKYGAHVTLCESSYPSREEAACNMAKELALSRNATLLHPFDDYEIIIGQASVALELQEQLEQSGIRCDHLLCPVGGGSLVAGASLVFGSSAQVWAVEVNGYHGMSLSLLSGNRCRAKGNIPCGCDALMALEPGVANLDITLKTGVKGVTVNSQNINQAVRLAFSEMNLVLEPSGAVAIAAIMENPELFKNKTVVAIGSGGNVDAEKYASILQSK